MSNKVLMVMPVMKGGGAERVASLLLNEFKNNGLDCEFLITSSKQGDIINRDLDEAIPVTFLQERICSEKGIAKLCSLLLRLLASVLCRGVELLGLRVPAPFAYLSFISQYGKEVKALRRVIEENPDTAVISFLQPSIPMTVLAARGLPNKVVISERGNPKRLMKHRYGFNFIKKYYSRADAIVFQTDDAKNTYPENISKKGVVIPNPVKSGLIEPYFGERKKMVTTFCRISRQKNLSVLAEAFAKLHKVLPDYRLKIIGDTQTEDDVASLEETKAVIKKHAIEDFVDFFPFSSDVHSQIVRDAVYVNSSDYEGMSNAMLEAMAIGMPVVCTDCPIGGAGAVIKNGENGLLTKVNDSDDMYIAIKAVLTDSELSEKLSVNGAKIRDDLSLSNVAKRWMELL